MRTGLSLLDFKLGLRMLVKYPALTLVGGLGLAVSIAISVGFFAFLSANVYPTLPLEEGDRIVALENRDVELNDEVRRALHDFAAWREELSSVRELGAFRDVRRNLITGEGPPELVTIAEITAAGFQVARVPPLLGRYLVEEDERAGAPPVVVIGHDVWRDRFASDPAIVGRPVRLSGTVHTIVGVMPAGFAFPRSHDLWTPLRADPAAYERLEGPEIFIFGRLAPGATMEQAQAELDAIGQRTAAAFAETHARIRPTVMPYTHSLTDIQGTTTWMVVRMQLMMSLLVLVVALNVAVLVYARTAMRQGEIVVRSALGASRARVITQLFIEALVLALGAAAVGLALAQVGVGLGNRIMSEELGTPFWMDYSLRPTTVLFTVGVAVCAAAIVGVLPAAQATGRRLQADLRQLGGGTGMRLGKTWTALIVAQVAIAVAALPAAVNLGWTEIRNATTRPTYAAEQFLVAGLSPERGATAGADAAEGAADEGTFGARLTELMRRVEAEPGVEGVTFRADLAGRGGPVEVEGVPAPPESPAGHRVASTGAAAGMLELFDARLLTGRGFQPGDVGEEGSAVIVNRAFVRDVLGGGDALGRQLRYAGPAVDEDASPAQQRAQREATPTRWYRIVGVVEDLHTNAMDPALVRPELFYPVAPDQVQGVSLAVRVRGSAASSLGPRLREIAAEVDPRLRLGPVRSLAEANRQDALALRLVALVVGLVLVSVFLLSAAGVYALTSFTVTRRRREIGIRSALGAQPREVLGSVFSRAARQIGMGLVIGIVAAALLDQGSGGELMGGRAAVLLPAFGVAMAVVGLLAALGPARRGLRIQPTEALRADP